MEALPKARQFVSRFSFVRPWMVSLLAALAICLLTLARNGWDPMAFVRVGQQFDPVNGVAGLGYDGQFAYQIALDPSHATPFLDVPAYRYQRILYPMLARWLALGSPAAIPWTLILVNLVSLSLGTLATERILHTHGHNRWYALAYGLFSGFLVSVRLDLTEPLAFALAQWGIYFFDRQRHLLSLLLLILASLTRELTFFFSAACVLTLFSERQWRKGLAWGAMAVLPFLLWQVFLRFWLGSWGVASGGAMSTSFEVIPFRGWWSMIYTQEPLNFALLSLVILAIALLPASIALIAGARALARRRAGLGVWLMLTNAVIFPFLPASTMLHLPGLLRILCGLVSAVLDFGAFESVPRAFRYAQFWLVLLLFGEVVI